MKKTSRALAVLSAGIVGAGAMLLGACNNGSDVPPGFTGTAISFYATYVNQYSSAAYTELVNTYNETQGVEDNVYVEMTPNAGSVGNLKSILTGVNSRYDVIMVQDDQFKGLAMESGRTGNGVFVNLEDLLTEEAKEELDWEQIPESLLNIWRFNTEKASADSDIGAKYLAGQGADLLAMPFNTSVHMLFYNTKIFGEMGINMVSVAEEDCGTGAYAKLMPHGYAEYAASYGAPFEGAKLSENELGESVYKVFNNRVPLSWEELRCLARAYQTHNNGGYGFMSEWWFSIGWSVGDDCIGWNAERKAYDFTIGDKDANYLALNDITVNGTQYEAGEVLDYEDMKYLHANNSAYQQLSADLYELPSMYDAFLEFNRLGIPEGKVAATDAGPNNDQTVEGYGVAKPTTQERTKEFTSGESPMLIETSQDVNLFNGTAVAGNFNVAPCPQYREFEGSTTRTVNGKEYLTLIDGSSIQFYLSYAYNTIRVNCDHQWAGNDANFGDTSKDNIGSFICPATLPSENLENGTGSVIGLSYKDGTFTVYVDGAQVFTATMEQLPFGLRPVSMGTGWTVGIASWDSHQANFSDYYVVFGEYNEPAAE
ncbi:MAG TPA: hypothetical protein H9670_02135 [Firmicutes bacterium]|nr:hypothetical protein [Bacillota bacterium]